jgi:hypothetical protein
MSMSNVLLFPGRRNFLKASAALTAGIAGIGLMPEATFSEDTDLCIVGPKKGYSPQIGTLVSQMGFMRWQVLHSVQGMSQKDLDFLLDEKANRIGAMLYHLAAAEAFYQANTFEGMSGDKPPAAWTDKWGVAMDLGLPRAKQS